MPHASEPKGESVNSPVDHPLDHTPPVAGWDGCRCQPDRLAHRSCPAHLAVSDPCPRATFILPVIAPKGFQQQLALTRAHGATHHNGASAVSAVAGGLRTAAFWELRRGSTYSSPLLSWSAVLDAKCDTLFGGRCSEPGYCGLERQFRGHNDIQSFMRVSALLNAPLRHSRSALRP